MINIKELVKKKTRSNKLLFRFFSTLAHISSIIKMLLFKAVSICLFPFKIKNRVILSNYKGQGFYDNPKYIALGLQKELNSLEIIYLTDDKQLLSQYQLSNIKFKKNSIFNQMIYLSTSRVWIDNSRKTYIPIKRGQSYIQTWHGGLGIKKVENAIENLSIAHKFNAYLDTKATDIMVSNSNHLTKIYKSDFGFKGDILQIGYPMNDVLFNNHKKNDKKFRILYAPTFRGDEKSNEIPSYFPDLDKLLKTTSEYHENVTILVRVHPSLFLDVENMYANPNIIDGNSTSDIKELITKVDLVISDYSSMIFDCLITNTPALILAKDFDNYQKSRGLYYKLESLPFPVCYSEIELQEKIVNIGANKLNYAYEKFRKDMGMVDDGKSTERFNLLVQNCLNNKN